ncbi:hypothetical protein DFH09DRAFT_937351 [Mycena vulgaris]|nr:hypothetical protein DFH09DRAFT_937351 [Mycena vulgaris]
MDFRVGGTSISSHAEARARISACDAQILDLELAIRVLQHERDTLQDQLDSYVYPVLERPLNEIVSEIFTHFLPPYPTKPPLWGLLSPFTLGQICHTWREIAVATPSLWHAIRLDLKYKMIDDMATPLHLVETWLDRSRVSPLSVTLDYYDETPI